MIEITFLDTVIPDAHLKSYPKCEEKITALNNQIIASVMDVEIDNIRPELYDDRYPGSLLYGVDWYNQTLIAREDGRTIWKGRAKNITVNDGKNPSLTIETANYIQDFASTTCELTSSADMTGADLVLKIIRDIIMVPEDDIVLAGFRDAIAIQRANSAYIRANVTAEQGKTCLQIIQELCRMTHCSIYSVDNKLCLYQYQQWAGELGNVVEARHLVSSTYKHSYDTSQIYNSAAVAYMNGSAVARKYSSDSSSVETYGTRSFNIPDQDTDETDPTKFLLIFKLEAGAAWSAALAVDRFKDAKKNFELSIGEELSYIRLVDQIDLNFSPFTREPARVLERKYDREKHTVTLKGAFLNIPEVTERDTTPPNPVELVAVLPAGNELLLKWTRGETAWYKVFYTTSPGQWYHTVSRQGISPALVKSVTATPDGFVCASIALEAGATYYFKVRAVTSNLIESVDSNIISAAPTPSPVPECMYCCSGTLYGGITLDMHNTRGGYLPTGFYHYDDLNYDAGTYAPTAIYDSPVIRNGQTIAAAIVRGMADDANDIMVQYRTYTNGSFGTWSTAVSAVGLTRVAVNCEAFQLRFLFHSPRWGDADNVALLSLEAE
jgi:hypothetical protein